MKAECFGPQSLTHLLHSCEHLQGHMDTGNSCNDQLGPPLLPMDTPSLLDDQLGPLLLPTDTQALLDEQLGTPLFPTDAQAHTICHNAGWS